MKVNTIGSAVVLFFLLISACKSEIEYNINEAGVEYRFIEHSSNTTKVKPGDLVQLRFNIFYNDSLLDSSKALWDTVDMLAKPSPYEGSSIESALQMLAPGDSAHFFIDAHKFYKYTKQQDAPDYMKVDDKLRFEIRLIKIYSEEEVKAKEADYEKKLAEREGEILGEYLASENITVKPSETGLYVIPIEQGTGARAQVGQIAKVHYTGKLIDGRVFDSSVQRGEPIEFTIGIGRVIQSWDEALLLMRVGDKIDIIAPSNIAYGPKGFGKIIPPYSTLIFEMELLELK